MTGISAQQKKRNRRKVEQMSELRLALEREKMERWEKIQRRLETVRIRREERLAELQRRSNEAKDKEKANLNLNSTSNTNTTNSNEINSTPNEFDKVNYNYFYLKQDFFLLFTYVIFIYFIG